MLCLTEKVLLLFVFLSLVAKTKLKAQDGFVELGSLDANWAVKSVYSDKSGNVYAAGYFTNDSGKYYVAKWDGFDWSELGGLNGLAANSYILSITGDKFGDIFVAGCFTNSNRMNYVAKWDGKFWQELGGVNSLSANWNIKSVICDSIGNVYAVGGFSDSNGQRIVTEWIRTKNKWTVVGNSDFAGLNAKSGINSVIPNGKNSIYVAGGFTDSSNKNQVIEWRNLDNKWHILGEKDGLAANNSINQICNDTSGNLYACGRFTNGIDSTNGKYYVAIWDGKRWSELGGKSSLGANASLNAIHFDEFSNSLFVAGDFSITNDNRNNCLVAKWDGVNWIHLRGFGASKEKGSIETIHGDSFGNIYVSGWNKNENGKYFVAKYSQKTLPLRIVSFSACSVDHNHVLIKFETTDERNVVNYSVERNYSGNNFETIVSINSSQSSISRYAYLDTIWQNVNKVCYRIVAHFKDGKKYYSNIIEVATCQQETFLVYPTQSNSGYFKLKIHSNFRIKKTLKVLDVSGNVKFNKCLNLVNGVNEIQLFLSFLNSGFYYLKIEDVDIIRKIEIVR